ncbi:HAMP domain-containing sensor histidine kinase [Alienimonas chondri]|uniref:histidine kinase n=1 Tax=Alienimonas chondri TaxID=2681879 RepID=A0ABX1VBC0_9PLAN|nr:HAMP domain-containing sensor histidine kinase [Alienimonas chondri]NNJ25068.1 Alkaline phosphatase synthesis sensor protein PhoR [Alienimonas chondri]
MVLLALNVALMIAWIIVLSRTLYITALTVGTVLFALVLVGSTAYLVLSIKAVRLHARQVNFVDSVTHELKTPLAAAKLYLETMQLRPDMPAEKRTECLEVMASELNRLEDLITQILEVGRLERLGMGVEVEDVDVAPLLRRAMTTAAAHHKYDPDEIFTADLSPVIVPARRMVLETIFGNLLDNAVKYGGQDGAPPRVTVEVLERRGRVVTRIADDGAGVPAEFRKKIFDLFYRGGNELERTRRGTGLGLYIVRTLVTLLHGKVRVFDRADGPGSVFEVDLPGIRR